MVESWGLVQGRLYGLDNVFAPAFLPEPGEERFDFGPSALPGSDVRSNSLKLAGNRRLAGVLSGGKRLGRSR